MNRAAAKHLPALVILFLVGAYLGWMIADNMIAGAFLAFAGASFGCAIWFIWMLRRQQTGKVE